MHFDWNITELCSQWSKQKYPIIDSENGLAMNKWQAINWINDV